MPSVSSTAEPGAKSGIIVTDTGERHIPSSLRPDGTQRKEIKIRPGYRPPEDVEVYKNRTAEAWKTRGSGGVPGADSLGSGIKLTPSNKNAKRREARKKAKANDEENNEGKMVEEQPNTTKAKMSVEAISKENEHAQPLLPAEKTSNPAIEKEKAVRNLKKKLRQAKELSEKKEKGDSLLPEQFEKVIKINELIRQLDSLGFDEDGEPKEP